METATLIAANTQRQIGYVIVGIVLIAMATYWLFNWIEGRKEAGSEIELAANRKPHMSDEEMETKRLDLSLTSGLVTLTIIAIALPLYWLGEPGRHSGLVEFTDDQFVRQGEEIYAENCAQCHGSANGDGGLAADFSLVDSSGVYVEQVQWQAPSLGAVLDRFSYDEFKYILNFGRQNSPMPAWGGPGGGPMTDQQIDKVIAYIAHEQKSSEEIAKGVLDGLSGAALAKARGDNYDLYTRQLQLEAELSEVQHDIDDAPEGADTSALEAAKDAILAEHGPIVDELAETAAAILVMSDTDQVVLGELLFNNPAAAGAYGCARCHSAGWSYNANAFPENPLLPPIENGSGAFGPSLVGVLDQFETAASMESFIVTGTKNGVAYGAFGQGDGGGQMPGFGACWAEDNPLDFPRIQGDRISGHCEGRSGTLTTDQIAAIVAYERSLGGEG
jgi:mono/diheme cytochrome c family protein